MYFKELIINFTLLQNCSRSIQANVVYRHAKLDEDISREMILDMLIIVFDQKSSEVRNDRIYTQFFLLPTGKKKPILVENVNIRKQTRKFSSFNCISKQNRRMEEK